MGSVCAPALSGLFRLTSFSDPSPAGMGQPEKSLVSKRSLPTLFADARCFAYAYPSFNLMLFPSSGSQAFMLCGDQLFKPSVSKTLFKEHDMPEKRSNKIKANRFAGGLGTTCNAGKGVDIKSSLATVEDKPR